MKVFLGLPLLALCLSGIAHADDEAISVPKALPLLLKVVTYDKSLESRMPEAFTLAIVSGPEQADERKDIATSITSSTVQKIRGKPFNVIALELKNLEALKTMMQAAHVTAALLVPSLSPAQAKTVAQAATAVGSYSFAFSTAHVRSGAALGVIAVGGKPKLLLNPTTVETLGAQLDPSVLRITTSVKE